MDMAIDIDHVRNQFEEKARQEFPTGLARGRHPVHGTYNHSGLEKRWKGFLSHAHVADNERETYRAELEALSSDDRFGLMPDVQSRIRQLLERFQ